MSCARRSLAFRSLLTILSLAALLGAKSPASAACSCTGMTIAHSNSTVTICSNEVLKFKECKSAKGSSSNGCASSKFAYTCPVGVTSISPLSQTTGFSINAALSGTAKECRSGQALQLTIESDFGVSKPKVLKTPGGEITVGTFTADVTNDGRRVYPNVGTESPSKHQLYGADSYTDPNASDLLIHETGNGVQWWWDNTDQTKDKASETATWKYRFFSFVQGSQQADGCACVFDIDVNWPANSTPTTTYTEVSSQSTRCHF